MVAGRQVYLVFAKDPQIAGPLLGGLGSSDRFCALRRRAEFSMAAGSARRTRPRRAGLASRARGVNRSNPFARFAERPVWLGLPLDEAQLYLLYRLVLGRKPRSAQVPDSRSCAASGAEAASTFGPPLRFLPSPRDTPTGRLDQMHADRRRSRGHRAEVPLHGARHARRALLDDESRVLRFSHRPVRPVEDNASRELANDRRSDRARLRGRGDRERQNRGQHESSTHIWRAARISGYCPGFDLMSTPRGDERREL
jgi:hypothetical protein